MLGRDAEIEKKLFLELQFPFLKFGCSFKTIFATFFNRIGFPSAENQKTKAKKEN